MIQSMRPAKARKQPGQKANRHGMSRTPEYHSWSSMMARCHSPSNNSFPRWGGKGIVVCERWRNSFLDFVADMGPRPKGTTLDRVDGAKGYEKGNCRWATLEQQSENRPSFVRKITFGGKTQSISAWAREAGINREALKYRINSGIPLNEALQKPSGSMLTRLSKTGVLGVGRHKNKFRARHYVNGKAVFIGLYDTIAEAKAAVVRAKEAA